MNVSTGTPIDATSLNSDSKAASITSFFGHTSRRIQGEEVLLTDGVEELTVFFFSTDREVCTGSSANVVKHVV